MEEAILSPKEIVRGPSPVSGGPGVTLEFTSSCGLLEKNPIGVRPMKNTCVSTKPLKTYPPSAFPCVKELAKMPKPLGYCAFKGWSPKHFYFFDRDKKNTVLSVKVANGHVSSPRTYKFTLDHFEV